jgi:pSer/pThr/pTyr-binding forkhead associated (FHA) protein
MWILRTLPEAANGTFRFRVSPGGIKTIGRAVRADFVVDVPLVSRLHCRITADDTGIDVFDLGSTNGTFVNDRRVQKARLVVGDRLRVGRLELAVERQTPGPEADAARDPRG